MTAVLVRFCWMCETFKPSVRFVSEVTSLNEWHSHVACEPVFVQTCSSGSFTSLWCFWETRRSLQLNWVKGFFCQKISPIYKFGKLFLSSLILKITFLLPVSFILNFDHNCCQISTLCHRGNRQRSHRNTTDASTFNTVVDTARLPGAPSPRQLEWGRCSSSGVGTTCDTK